MAWIIQSISQGPILINDLGIMLSFNQTRDIDLIGRENAERSNDIKYLLNKGMIKTIRKDPHQENKIDPALVAEIKNNSEEMKNTVQNLAKINDSVDQATQAAHAAQQVAEQVAGEMENQKKQNEQILSSNQAVLEMVKQFAEKHPVEIRKMKEAVENIKVAREVVAEKQEELVTSGDTEEEINTQEKILKLKDERLTKNLQNIGKKIVKSDEKEEIDGAIDELDNLI